jgi:hypothetical protein
MKGMSYTQCCHKDEIIWIELNWNTIFNFHSKFTKHDSLIITLVSSANITVEESVLDNECGITDGKSLI